MLIRWQAIIDRARTYVDDDHDETSGWLSPEKWLVLAQVEYEQIYARWIRQGVINVAPIDVTFTGPSVYIGGLSEVDPDAAPSMGDPVDANENGVLCVIGVAEVVDTDRYRRLVGSQEHIGMAPIRSTNDSPASSWSATGAGDALMVNLHPADTQGTYLVRYMPVPIRTEDPTDTVILPFGRDERIVLGLAKRAGVKESSASALLERLIIQCDEEAAFAAATKNGGLRVRRTKSTPSQLFPTDPSQWTFTR